MPRRCSLADRARPKPSPRGDLKSLILRLIIPDNYGAPRGPGRYYMSSVSNMPESGSEWSGRWALAFVGVALVVALASLGVLVAILGYSPIALIRQALD